MTDDKFLAAVRKDREDRVSFFSSNRKEERELWVAREFLVNLGIEFSEEELLPSTQEPIDVFFRSVSFQVKEILDEDRRRHAEAKRSLEIARQAKIPEDLIEPCVAKDITFTEIVSIIDQKAEPLAKTKYSSTKTELDLLFYIGLENSRAFAKESDSLLESLASRGFRSISYLMGRNSVVLVASSRAPTILQSRAELTF